ncbi:hypothetical protein IEO21_07322 [Rhodonia placenta]|uniref:Uncharacterized protein n=1 Tax=Rhodonia placenta TaxID=104341 RepID=A0A8H7NYQ7_9APHY|nr:hypothetical protein IEO21_07322 [Postia placenta]
MLTLSDYVDQRCDDILSAFLAAIYPDNTHERAWTTIPIYPIVLASGLQRQLGGRRATSIHHPLMKTSTLLRLIPNPFWI